MKIVTDYKSIPKHISTVCMGIYTAAITVFNLLPPEMQNSFDQQTLRWLSIALMIIGIGGKYVDQSSKNTSND